jgi:hypothetical protein
VRRPPDNRAPSGEGPWRSPRGAGGGGQLNGRRGPRRTWKVV